MHLRMQVLLKRQILVGTLIVMPNPECTEQLFGRNLGVRWASNRSTSGSYTSRYLSECFGSRRLLYLWPITITTQDRHLLSQLQLHRYNQSSKRQMSSRSSSGRAESGERLWSSQETNLAWLPLQSLWVISFSKTHYQNAAF